MSPSRPSRTIAIPRTAAALAATLGAACLPASAAARQSVPPPVVSLNLRDAELGTALVMLAERAGGTVRFEATPEARALRVTAVINGQSVETALRTLLRAASPALTFTAVPTAGRLLYRISARASGTKAEPLAVLLTLDVSNGSLDDVMRLISLAAGEARVEGADPAGVSVSAAFSRLPLDRALDAIAGGARPTLQWSREGGAVVFRPLTGAFSGGAAPSP